METRFQIRDFLKVFTFSILLFTLFAGIFRAVPGIETVITGVHPSLTFLISYLIQFLVLFFPVWFFVVDKYSATPADFGIKKIKIFTVIKTVFVAYLFYLFLSLIINLVLGLTGLELPGYQEQESYLPLFGYDPFGITVAIITVSILAPFLEEFFFRGFVYQIFIKTWPKWLGSALTALLFALIHFQLQTLIPLFILGLILNYIYSRTGSLWTSIAFHSLNNSIAFGLDLYLYFHPEVLEKLQTLSQMSQ